MGYMPGCNKRNCSNRYNACRRCESEMARLEREARDDSGTMSSSVFASKTQRDDSSVTNDYFNAGKKDGASHGHAKYRNNPDGSTDYLYVRDVEGNEYDV